MSPTPWDVLASAMTRLKDRVDDMPAFREATVQAVSPAAVLFDTDTVPTLVQGSLVQGLAVGQRVFTTKIKHYVWIIGVSLGQNGGYQQLTTLDLDTVLTHGLYEAGSVVNGTLARHYPFASWAGIVEVYQSGGHLFQRATFRGDGPNAGRVHVRSKFSTNAFRPWRELTRPALPTAIYRVGPATTTIAAGALVWTSLGVSYTFPAQEKDLLIDVNASSICKASTGYTMMGVDISGGITLGPTFLPDGTDFSGATPFTSSAVDTAISIHPKRVLLPAGQTAVFQLWARRSVASGTQTINYPILSLAPVAWVDAV